MRALGYSIIIFIAAASMFSVGLISASLGIKELMIPDMSVDSLVFALLAGAFIGALLLAVVLFVFDWR